MSKAISTLNELALKVNSSSVYEFLHECFLYDPTTGIFKHKNRPLRHFKTKHGYDNFTKLRAGREAGTKYYCRGGAPLTVKLIISVPCYPRFRIGAHNVAMLMSGASIPPGCEVDHIDRNPFNNVLSNLRIATKSQNGSNRKKAKRVRGHHLPKGVMLLPSGIFRSYVYCNGKRFECGTHSSLENATKARMQKARSLYGEFSEQMLF